MGGQKLYLICIILTQSGEHSAEKDISFQNYSSPSSLYMYHNESLIIIGLCVQSRLFTLKQLENKRQDDSVFDDKTKFPHIPLNTSFEGGIYTIACLKIC